MLTQRASYTDCSEMKETYITHSTEETEALGASVASGHGCAFTALYGDLGAGKTVFVRGMVSVLSPDAKNLVHSPTYAIVNEYGDAGQRVYHFDMYRIKDEDELYATGFYEFADSGTVICEWSENIGFAIPDDALRVRIERLDDTTRKITVTDEREP